jgi:hypothetical protein
VAEAKSNWPTVSSNPWSTAVTWMASISERVLGGNLFDAMAALDAEFDEMQSRSSNDD